MVGLHWLKSLQILLYQLLASISDWSSCQQGPVAVGGKVENRLKLPKKAKLISTLGRMTCNTRMGRENATAGQAELRLRLSDDQRSQVPHPLLPTKKLVVT